MPLNPLAVDKVAFDPLARHATVPRQLLHRAAEALETAPQRRQTHDTASGDENDGWLSTRARCSCCHKAQRQSHACLCVKVALAEAQASRLRSLLVA